MLRSFLYSTFVSCKKLCILYNNYIQDGLYYAFCQSFLKKDVNGEMIISSAGSTLSALKWNVLGVIIIAGGVAYIVESVRRIRLRNKRLNGN